MIKIYTKHLILWPITWEITAALLDKKTAVLEQLGLYTDGSWPTADTMDILPLIYETLRQAPPSGFETWLIVRQEDNKIVGDIGFHSKPNEQGEAEIGYGLVSAEQGKGFGYEALQAIVDWAVKEDSVYRLKAACLTDNIASQRILQKTGFCEITRGDGYVYWQFVKTLA
jgi:RimJ/RimL family protein N-acetyltransferase